MYMSPRTRSSFGKNFRCDRSKRRYRGIGGSSARGCLERIVPTLPTDDPAEANNFKLGLIMLIVCCSVYSINMSIGMEVWVEYFVVVS